MEAAAFGTLHNTATFNNITQEINNYYQTIISKYNNNRTVITAQIILKIISVMSATTIKYQAYIHSQISNISYSCKITIVPMIISTIILIA